MLESLSDDSSRNALALRLAETRDPRVLSSLLRLIGQPNLENSRGTLVHCLSFYEPAGHFELLAGLVCDGNWEVAQESYAILEAIESLSGAQVSAGFARIEALLREGVADEWRRQLLGDLLAMFE